MNEYFFSLIAFSVFTNISLAQDMEEVVVTSSLVDTSEITNPLYIVDGDDISGYIKKGSNRPPFYPTKIY